MACSLIPVSLLINKSCYDKSRKVEVNLLYKSLLYSFLIK